MTLHGTKCLSVFYTRTYSICIFTFFERKTSYTNSVIHLLFIQSLDNVDYTGAALVLWLHAGHKFPAFPVFPMRLKTEIRFPYDLVIGGTLNPSSLSLTALFCLLNMYRLEKQCIAQYAVQSLFFFKSF